MTETKRPQTLQDHIDAKRVIKISAADFNGKDFDGQPLTLVGQHADRSIPAWMQAALLGGEISVGTPGSTDYASFGVKLENGTTMWAGPGDYIVAHAVGATFSQYFVVPWRFLQMLGIQDIELLALTHSSVQFLKSKDLDPVLMADRLARAQNAPLYTPDPANPRV